MPESTNKPVIFLAFANDRDETVGYLRNLPDEARRLRAALQPAEQAGLCEVVVRSNSTADDIFKVFQDPKYRNRIAIFHYGGHANGYQLLLESAAGPSAAADAGGLAAFLAQQQGLQLVFLNGCSTFHQTHALLDANIPAVISTSRSIDDGVATDFSSQFYLGLGSGAGMQKAFDEAAAVVETTQGQDTRALYFGDTTNVTESFDADRLPWLLAYRAGKEHVAAWNLPNAVDDPLFGLPPLPEQDLPESPYRHLNWFTRQDADVYFGRGHQIRALYDRLTAPRAAPIMLFYGQSGVGKSSIIDAGLIPRLEAHYEVRYLRRTEGGLLDTLCLAFLPEASDVPIETAWRAKEQTLGKPLIVFLDQVEESFTRPIPDLADELSQLLEVIKATFIESSWRPKGRLVLSFRKEWLAELEARLVAHELPRTKVFLEALDRRSIIEVVSGPARSERLRERYGLTVEDGLAELIADDLLEDRDSSIAPTLQILLTKMWAKATEENYSSPCFSRDLYYGLKRDGILLRDFLNQQIAAFRERYPAAVDSGLLLDIVALHTTPLGTADCRSVEQLREQYSHLDATLPELLQQCQDLHLLTVSASAKKENAKTTRLAHDTLAPLVREQFDISDKPGQRARRILDNRSVDWEGGRAGTPLDAADLAIVEQGANGTRAMSATERRLLDASRELRARLVRVRRISKIAATVAALVIVAFAGVAFWKWCEAETALGREKQANLRAFLAASAGDVEQTAKRLGEWAVPYLLRTQQDDASPASHRLHAAFGLTLLGRPQGAYLLGCLADVRPEEMENLQAAFMSCSEDAAVISELADLAGRSDDNALKASSVLVALGKADLLRKLKATEGDPERRTRFVHHYHTWFGGSDKLLDGLLAANDNDVRATLCLAFGFIEKQRVPDGLTEKIKELYVASPSGAVHSAARSTLVRWDQELPPLDGQRAATSDWYVNSIGLVMTAVPMDDDGRARFIWTNTMNHGQLHSVTLTRRFFVSVTEVTVAHMANWPSGPSIPPVRVSSEAELPAQEVGFYDAIEFCNWLSKQEGRTPCYSKDGPTWNCDFDKDGYRLPTEAEWKYACRGGAATRYCFGDDPSLLAYYGWTVENAGGRRHAVGSLLPNAWGLFDMHGNMLEWCWDPYDPLPPADATDPIGGRPSESGRTACGGFWGLDASDSIADDRAPRAAGEPDVYIGLRIVRTMIPPAGKKP